MRLPLIWIDAFAERPFEGNPAAVMPLERWLDGVLLQRIAAQNNLSETAYLVAVDESASEPVYALRWFTPATEVDLCGHATLASAAYLLDDVHPAAASVQFDTRSGRLTVTRAPEGRLEMDFPAEDLTPVAPDPQVLAALGLSASAVRESLSATDLVYVVDRPDTVRELRPDHAALARLDVRGVMVTAAGDGDVDVVSRWFVAAAGVPEDPVTGSAHSQVAPYWAARLGRTELIARQESPRGGTVWCRVEGDRVTLAGHYRRYLVGTVTLD